MDSIDPLIVELYRGLQNFEWRNFIDRMSTELKSPAAICWKLGEPIGHAQTWSSADGATLAETLLANPGETALVDNTSCKAEVLTLPGAIGLEARYQGFCLAIAVQQPASLEAESQIQLLFAKLRQHLMMAVELAERSMRYQGLNPLDLIGASNRQPQFLVNFDARVLHMNEAARDLLAKAPYIQVRTDKRIQFGDFDLDRSCAAAVRRMARNTASEPPAAFPVRTEDHNVMAYVVLRRHRAATDIVKSPVVSVTWHRIDELPQPSALSMQEAFGLTPSEAAVAIALASGRSLRDYADANGTQITTVRWHLHNAMHKTNTSTQLELGLLVLSMMIMLG